MKSVPSAIVHYRAVAVAGRETRVGTEFGFQRTTCGCKDCRRFCRHLPGNLIPSDLERMIPAGVDPYKWAEDNLRASPGPKVMNTQTGKVWTIPTLIPAHRSNGACIFFSPDGKCDIHSVAPFGCAFFDSHGRGEELVHKGLEAIMHLSEDSLYLRIWSHLNDLGLVGRNLEEKHAALRADFARGR